MTQQSHKLGRITAAVMAAAMALTFAQSAFAKGPLKHDGTIEAGVFFGYEIVPEQTELGNAFYNDNVPVSGLALGLRGAYNLTNMFAVEGEMRMTPTSFKSTEDPATILGLRALFLAHLNLMNGRLRPFAAIGYGFEFLMTEQEFAAANGRQADQAVSDADAALHLGLGVKYHVIDPLLLRLDLRYLNVAGRDDLTTHGFEILVGASYVIDTAVRDGDGDGILDDKDKCPMQAEDKDGFEDEDGCPEADNDSDGIPDTDDKCPNKAEDKDGWEDKDGCPELDNDKDGIPDNKDKCPNKAEDKDGFRDSDGCPEPDNDGDGIPDADDKCPNEAGPASEKGCPIKDADKDGIPDKLDKCPNKPESFNGYKDDDGCPDKKSLVVITKNEIKIMQKVYFEIGKADIKKVSFTLLDTVAVVLNKHPEITKIEVQGHTDDTGNDSMNLKLSKERARSVLNYLVEKGVATTRLESKGYGEQLPLCQEVATLSKQKSRKAKKALAACRELNRRVQFKMREVNGKPVAGGDSVTIETKKIIRAK